MIKSISLIAIVFILNSCVTYKTTTVHVIAKGNVTVNAKTHGSDAVDSLNGNEPQLDIPLL